MLEITRKTCDSHVMSYQKDGFGRLLRCYLDRIHAPHRLQQKQYEAFDVHKSAHLRCLSCLEIIGVPMIYRGENRPAFKMLKSKAHRLLSRCFLILKPKFTGS